jgi:hypothetical protein
MDNMGFLIINENIKESSNPDMRKIQGVKGLNKKKYVVIYLFKRMKLILVLLGMFVGYVINGMKEISNFNLLIKINKINFLINKIKLKFLYIFNLKIIYRVFLRIINKKIFLKIIMLYQIETFIIFLQ